ncbi:MAG: Hint domain-containing protein [Maritimibacter sp.]|uniref:Hint domain-containing protein n=1 Tax=Maritimibacter sp. TaxID=2003363 RepID=UPI001DD72866|nr:Hint domain-containing protein [Maritimibacter sp.]MBL6429606.1 Hint domain-containing protein [Maritimibacter sp.]
MPIIGVYDWSAVAIPAALTPDHRDTDLDANDPGALNYDPSSPTWVGQTYTYTGAGPVHLKVIDDDGMLEDNNAETGAMAVLAADVTLNGVTYAAGSTVYSEFSLVDGSGAEVWIITIDGTNVGFSPQVPYYYVPPGATFYPKASSDVALNSSSTGDTNTVAYAGVVCFTAGTMIDTPSGPVPAERLGPGDLVRTLDHGAQVLRWTGMRRVTLGRFPHRNRPVSFAPGSLGGGWPRRTLVVSPQHRVLLRGGEVRRSFGVGEVLAPAIGLTDLAGARVLHGRSVATYVHLLLTHHEVLIADGAPCESLHLGPMTRRALGNSLPPRLRHERPARPLVTRAEAARHARRLRKRARNAQAVIGLCDVTV